MTRSILLTLGVLSATVMGIAQDAQPKLVIDSRGHGGIVNKISFTPDGSQLITSANDKLIRVWDVSTGSIFKSYRHRQGDNFEGVQSPFGMSVDGRYLTFSTGTQQAGPGAFDVRVIDRQQDKIVALLRGHAAVVTVSVFSKDGQTLLTGDAAGQIRIWKLSSFSGLGAVASPEVITDSLYLVGHSTPVGVIDTNRDCSLILSVDNAGQGLVWQRQANGFYNGLGDLGQGSGNVAGGLISQDDQFYVGAGKDGKIYILSNTYQPLQTIDVATGGSLTCMALSPDGSKLAVGWALNGCGVDIYSVPGGNLLARYEGQPAGTSAVAWHPDGVTIACAGGDNNDIDICQVKGGQVELISTIEGDGAGVWAVAIAKDLSQSIRVAFGQRNDYSETTHDDKLDNTLHRTFDFTNMVFTESEDPSAYTDFARASWDNGGRHLSYGDPFRLNVSGVGQVVVNQNTNDQVRSFSFTPEGNLIAGTQFVLSTFSQSGQLLTSFPEQLGPTFAMAPSLDGQYLATASGDQAIHLWNLKTGKKLASLFVSRDGEWVCWTTSGHYAASPGGEKYVGWHLNRPAEQLSDFYPSSVFREQFHRPDVVREVVARGNVQDGLVAAARGSSSQPVELDVTTILPPKVEWVLPAQASGETSTSNVTVKTRITSKGSPLNEVKLLLNGKAIESFHDLNGENYDLEHEVELLPGENRFAVFARNNDSGATSEERKLVFRSASVPSPPTVETPTGGIEIEELPPEMMPNLYMLSVGVSKYAKAEMELSFCDDDARALAEVFANQKGRLFNRTEIKTLVDQDATRDGILTGLEWLQQNATQKDVIILFLAAHGVNEGRNYYLVPHDGEFESLRRTGVAWGDFADILGNLPAKTLMFLDTCHSGQLGSNLYTFNTRGATKNATDASEAIRELTSDENGVVVMAASTQGESSVEHDDWGHGAFTYALIEGLTGKADFIQDGIIQLRELDTYVAERVKELSQGIQHPTTVKPSSISRFPLIRIR